MAERLDVVIFGASGFTGKYTIIELINIIDKLNEKLTWGVSGRNQSKLEDVLKEVGDKLDRNLEKTPMLIADIGDELSLHDMAKRAKVVINCCGPYARWGEPVVKACIANKTHHVDVSGEPLYMEKIQLKYHEEAEKNGVYIVSACGFDSIPADLGIVFFQKQFEGEVNSVETILEGDSGGSTTGASIHFGTWDSAVHGIASAKELGPVRRQLFPTKLPKLEPKLNPRSPVHSNEIVKKWCLPFPGSDKSVIYRTQRYFFEKEKKRPVQVYTYVAFDSLFTVLRTILIAAAFNLMCNFSFGRSLLLKYPKFFSGGFIDHDGPPEEEAKKSKFSITFSGNGWSEKAAGPSDNHQDPPNKRLVTRVSGPNPGYGSTCICLVMAALTILKENKKMPSTGGVYPPGAAFANTSLIDQLDDLGVKFEVVSKM